MTLTSTYDHRVIQGAESGQFLDWMHKLPLGEEGFGDEIFRSMRVPYQPVRNSVDRRPPLGSSLRESENLERAAGVMTIRSYRVRGHVLAKLDPLTFEPKNLPGSTWRPTACRSGIRSAPSTATGSRRSVRDAA